MANVRAAPLGERNLFVTGPGPTSGGSKPGKRRLEAREDAMGPAARRLHPSTLM